MISSLPYDIKSATSIFEYSKGLLGRTLRDFVWNGYELKKGKDGLGLTTIHPDATNVLHNPQGILFSKRSSAEGIDSSRIRLCRQRLSLIMLFTLSVESIQFCTVSSRSTSALAI